MVCENSKPSQWCEQFPLQLTSWGPVSPFPCVCVFIRCNSNGSIKQGIIVLSLALSSHLCLWLCSFCPSTLSVWLLSLWLLHLQSPGYTCSRKKEKAELKSHLHNKTKIPRSPPVILHSRELCTWTHLTLNKRKVCWLRTYGYSSGISSGCHNEFLLTSNLNQLEQTGLSFISFHQRSLHTKYFKSLITLMKSWSVFQYGAVS